MPQESKTVTEKAKQGIFYTMMARLSGTFFQFFGSVALARLLAVEDFGVVQMGMMVIGFATRFGEFGFNLGLIQRREEVRREHINSLFALDLTFKLILFTAVVLSVPFLMNYFHEPRLKTVMPAIAFYMVLDCFGNPGTAMLKRQMNFQKYSQIKIVERFLEISLAVLMACLNFQIWSLILSRIIAVSVSAVMASRAARWYPSFKVDFKASKDLFRFGGWVFFRDLCRYMANNVDYFFISRYLSTQALGFYTRAFDVMRLPQRRITRAVNSVLFAAFSRVQDQPEKVRAGFQKVVLAVSLVTYPILLGMMVTAPDFVHVVYGQKWVPMVIPLQIMCVAGILRSIDPFLNSVVTATGFVSHAAFRRLMEFGALTLATFIGVKHGIIGVSVAVVIVSVLVMFLMVSLLKRVGAAGWREYLGPQWPALSGSLIMVTLMLGLRFLLEQIPVSNPVVRLAAMTMVGFPSYLGFLLLVRPKRVTALYEEIAGDIQKLTRKDRKKLTGWFERLGFAQSAVK